MIHYSLFQNKWPWCRRLVRLIVWANKVGCSITMQIIICNKHFSRIFGFLFWQNFKSNTKNMAIFSNFWDFAPPRMNMLMQNARYWSRVYRTCTGQSHSQSSTCAGWHQTWRSTGQLYTGMTSWLGRQTSAFCPGSCSLMSASLRWAWFRPNFMLTFRREGLFVPLKVTVILYGNKCKLNCVCYFSYRYSKSIF